MTPPHSPAQASTDGPVSRFRPSWPLLVGLTAFLLVVGRLSEVLNDPDTYLHVAAGNWMLAHHALPTSDPFSHSVAGNRWTPHEWLAELILALLWRGFGWAGLAVATALCFALAMTVVAKRLLDRFEPLSGLIATVLVIMLLEPHLLARAHALALPLMAVWCGTLIAARDAGRTPPWWLLPVMLLWANLHGSFMAGLVLLAYLGSEAVLQAGQDRMAVARRWAGFGLAAGLAALATPNGIDGFLMPFRISGMKVLQSSFIEWQSPDLQNFQPITLWLVAAVIGLAAGLRLPILRLVVVTALLLNALAHQRHADLLAIMGPFLLAASLGPALAVRIRTERPSPVARAMSALARPARSGGIIAVLAVIIAISALALARPLPRGDGPITPASALAQARTMKIEGNVFNDEGFGGYLIFEGVPVFIDGRIELYGDEFLSKYLSAMSGHQPGLDELLDRYHIGWTLLSPDSVAVAELDRSPDWRRAYSDKIAVIHVRTGTP